MACYIINPSFEYLSSGPLHFELTGHLDDGDGGDPTLLDYWRGTHYGGSVLNFAANEFWTKVVGPIFIYVPTGADPKTLFTDAKKEVPVEQARWPYTFVKGDGVDYPQAAERTTVKGRLKVIDPQAPNFKFTTLFVGLSLSRPGPRPARSPHCTAAPAAPPTSNLAAHRLRPSFVLAAYQPPADCRTPRPAPTTVPDNGATTDHSLLPNGQRRNRGTYVAPRPEGAPAAGARPAGFAFQPQGITWQDDAKHYEFWVYGIGRRQPSPSLTSAPVPINSTP